MVTKVIILVLNQQDLKTRVKTNLFNDVISKNICSLSYNKLLHLKVFFPKNFNAAKWN